MGQMMTRARTAIAVAWAFVVAAMLFGPEAAYARCTVSGNTTFCVSSDGSSRTTTRVGNTTIIDDSTGYHSTETTTGNRTVAMDNNGHVRAESQTITSDNQGNFSSTIRTGDHTFRNGVNANTGGTWSASETQSGHMTIKNGTIDGQTFVEIGNDKDHTVVYAGTAGQPWATFELIVGNHNILSSMRADGSPYLRPQQGPQQEPQQAQSFDSGTRSGGGSAPAPSPIWLLCPVC
jgi:hypothetical protein